MNHVLFLCSGNYYRSRYAEVVFNHVAAEHGLWRAESRGFRLHPGNFGPISTHALEGLGRVGISLVHPPRNPLVAAKADLRAAALIVAVNEREHRPMMSDRFPEWVSRVEFWQIDDIDFANPADALPLLHRHVIDLSARLHAACDQ